MKERQITRAINTIECARKKRPLGISGLKAIVEDEMKSKLNLKDRTRAKRTDNKCLTHFTFYALCREILGMSNEETGEKVHRTPHIISHGISSLKNILTTTTHKIKSEQDYTKEYISRLASQVLPENLPTIQAINTKIFDLTDTSLREVLKKSFQRRVYIKSLIELAYQYKLGLGPSEISCILPEDPRTIIHGIEHLETILRERKVALPEKQPEFIYYGRNYALLKHKLKDKENLTEEEIMACLLTLSHLTKKQILSKTGKRYISYTRSLYFLACEEFLNQNAKSMALETSHERTCIHYGINRIKKINEIYSKLDEPLDSIIYEPPSLNAQNTLSNYVQDFQI